MTGLIASGKSNNINGLELIIKNGGDINIKDINSQNIKVFF